MREKIPVRAEFQVVVTATARGAAISIGGVHVADLVAASSVVTQYQTLFGGLSIHPGFGDLLEELASQTMLRKSGWNDEASGAVEPVKRLDAGRLAPDEGLVAGQSGIFARMTATVKEWFSA